MSIICTTEHDESIYHSIRPPKILIEDSPRYESKAKKYLERERRNQIDIRECATMGPPGYALPDPKNFLRKNAPKHQALFKVYDAIRQKPKMEPVPKRDEVLKEQDAKFKRVPQNFIWKNRMYAVTLKPKEPEEKLVLNRFGESKPIIRGLEPKFIFKPNFGCTPKYLKGFIKRQERVHQKKKDVTTLGQIPKCRYLTRDERAELLAGLKHNWQELQQTYQGLPVITDTIPKINRKAKLEKDLLAIEKDIQLVERHPYIYIYDD